MHPNDVTELNASHGFAVAFMRPRRDELMAWTKANIDPLRNLALSGDTEATKNLVALAHLLCGAVKEIEDANIDLVVPLARRQSGWPMIVGGNFACSRTALEQRVETLQLGKACSDAHVVAPEAGRKRIIDLESTAQAVIERAMFWLRAAQRTRISNLHPQLQARAEQVGGLRPENRTEYENLLWEVIVDQCGGDVFNHPTLPRIGLPAFDHYLAQRKVKILERKLKREQSGGINSASAGIWEQIELAKANRAAEKKQRQSIEQQVRQAFRARFPGDCGK